MAAAARRVGAKVRAALPPALDPAALSEALRRELPSRTEDAVRARLAADRRLAGCGVAVSGEGGVVTLRGVVPDATARRVAVSLAENTAGVERVVDELAVPVE
ncbi:MAG: transport-associated protein [Isosphaera sp.]|nr:transport-associated protein [Isosphaera sp.]